MSDKGIHKSDEADEQNVPTIITSEVIQERLEDAAGHFQVLKKWVTPLFGKLRVKPAIRHRHLTRTVDVLSQIFAVGSKERLISLS